MARHSIAGRATVVGTNLRAIASLFAVVNTGGRLREVGVFNTTAVATAVQLARFTNATGVGAGLTEAPWDEDTGAPTQCTGFAGHTADGAVGGVFRQVPLGAAIGFGHIWTFGDNGILIKKGTANGIGIIIPSGSTGQICDYYFDWDE
jgi:hypothetical protein